MVEKQVLEIIKEKDEYRYSVEMSQNAKGDAQLHIKLKFDVALDDFVKDQATKHLKQMKTACEDLGIPIAGVKK